MSKVWEFTQEDSGVVLAVKVLFQLWTGALRLDDHSVAPAPSWGVRFFNKIEASAPMGIGEVQRIPKCDGPEEWEVVQWLELSAWGAVVAKVELVGRDMASSPGTHWAVRKVEYRDLPIGFPQVAEAGPWQEIRFNPQAFVLTRV